MVSASGTTGRVPSLRRGILFLLVLTMMATMFGTVLAAPADAASYKVKSWKEGNMHCYYVYQGSAPQNPEPTFCRWDSDVYKSGNNKVSFYWQWDNADDAKADAFWRYLGNKTSNSWTAWYYSLPLEDVYIYYVFKIEGWNINKDSLDKLQKQAPFKNSEGNKLYFEYIGSGDLVNSKSSEIRNVWKCSKALYWPQVDATVGLRFVDKDGSPIYCYCP